MDSNSADTLAVMVRVLDQLADLPAIQRVRRIARAAMGVRDGQRLLDAGCGVGEESRQLARLVGPEGEVTAVDLSRALVAAAEQRDNGSGVRYAVGDIAALDFPDATFHAVRSERVIQHVPDADAAIAELVRVTVPGGRVCLIDTDWESVLMDGMPVGYLPEFARLGREKGLVFKPAGRLLRGQLVRAGLTQVTAEPVAIPMTDRHTAERLGPFFNRQTFDLVLNAPGELADAWFGAFDDALVRNEFLAVLTIWVVAGTKAP